ncbi:olfactory receptor 52Z1P-like [Dendropsophus ebraccatus]|uniref:olfactory receptor 52Z1P-like n=1 Tax=Dendropsophus ebraccatus TaxID=150705 RepID=UPI003831003C
MESQADKRRPSITFATRDKVWLSAKYVWLTISTYNLGPRFLGPFMALNRNNPVAYKLRLPQTMRIPNSFHVSQQPLRLCFLVRLSPSLAMVQWIYSFYCFNTAANSFFGFSLDGRTPVHKHCRDPWKLWELGAESKMLLMENFTFSPSVLTLNFGELTPVKYLYWVLAFIGYILIIFLNGVVTSTVWYHKSLQEPMYIFISVMCMNGLYGSSAFFPNLLINLLQKNPSISYIACLVQAFCIHTYGSYEMTILASMAYDRYVSICNPLRYNRIMTMSTVLKMLLGAWLYPTVLNSILIILVARLPLCGTNILKIYCENLVVMRLSCVDTSVNNVYGLVVTVPNVGLPSLMIFYSYVRIIRVCMKSSKDTKEKALQTCTPHLITIVNFYTDTLFEILSFRLPPTNLPSEVKVFTSLQFMVVPPILNPVIYGLKLRAIKAKVKQLLLGKQTKIQEKVIQ